MSARKSPGGRAGAAAGGAAWPATPTIGQPHDSTNEQECQMLPHLQELEDLAEKLKQAGDRGGYLQARRLLLLAQAKLWQALHPEGGNHGQD